MSLLLNKRGAGRIPTAMHLCRAITPQAPRSGLIYFYTITGPALLLLQPRRRTAWVSSPDGVAAPCVQAGSAPSGVARPPPSTGWGPAPPRPPPPGGSSAGDLPPG